MSQNSEQPPETRSRRERTIPIEIESAMSVENVAKSKGLSDKGETKLLVDSENFHGKGEECNSPDENIVCSSVHSLSLSTDDELSIDTQTDGDIVNMPQRSLQNSNVPEKIIIVLDRALDENCTNFEAMSGKKYPPLFMLQHALKIFLQNKTAIDNRHEYALILLNENSATWVHNFTNSPLDIIRSLQTVTACEIEDIFNLNPVFDLILEHAALNLRSDTNPPLSVVRTVLLYGRSYSIPHLNRTKEIEKLLNSPCFTFDVIMTHEPPSSANHCDKIFKALQEIDIKGFAYSFAVSRNASELHVAMAKVLSHSHQRPHQSNANYNISCWK